MGALISEQQVSNPALIAKGAKAFWALINAHPVEQSSPPTIWAVVKYIARHFISCSLNTTTDS
jgi:hypothetical protein